MPRPGTNPRIFHDEETARKHARMKEIEKRSMKLTFEVGNLEEEII